MTIHRTRLAPAVLTVGLFLGGCGSTTGSPQPDGLGGQFEPSSIASDVPIPVEGVAYGDAVVSGNTTSQSFEITGGTAQEAIDSYVSLAESAGWVTTEPVAATGSADFSAELAKDDAVLLVTSAPGGGGGNNDPIELSLEVTTS